LFGLPEVRIGLYNLEPQYKNLALEKIRAYYQSHNHTVEYMTPFEATAYDQIYCSSLFNWTDKRYILPHMIKGGTGFYVWDKDKKTYIIPKDTPKLLPPEIDAVEPHINSGFTSIGCPNNCPFCVVRIKEGLFKIIGTILSLWDGKAKLVVCYDNNILASPEHFALNAELARKHKIAIDYNQGLDHRKLTPEIIDITKTYKHPELHFAFDNPTSIGTVEKAINMLQSKGIMRCNWYILTGYDTTLKEDLFRLNYLRSRNQNAFVQKFREPDKKIDKKYIPLARWANQHSIFQGMTWEQFLKHPTNQKYTYLLNETE
jgi:hypothetical protein